MRFIQEVIQKRIELRNVKKSVIVENLENKQFVKMSDMIKVKSTKIPAKREADKNNDSGSDDD